MSKSFAEFGSMRKSSLVVPSKQPSIPIANIASGEPENNLQLCPTTIARDEMNRYKAETALKWSDEMFSDEWLLFAGLAHEVIIYACSHMLRSKEMIQVLIYVSLNSQNP